MENPIEQFRKIKRHEIHLILVSFVGLLSPGVLSIWAYQPALITSLSFFVLVLLALSLSLPAAFINYLILDIKINDTEGSEPSQEVAHFSLGVLLIGVSVILLLSINLFLSISLEYYVLSVVILNFLLVFITKWALSA